MYYASGPLWDEISAKSARVRDDSWVGCVEGSEGFKVVCSSGGFGGKKVLEFRPKVAAENGFRGGILIMFALEVLKIICSRVLIL